jgi:hypothetical protein
MSTSLIVIIYVDDILFYGRCDEDITKLIKQLQKEEVALHCEGTAEGYIGNDIQRNGRQLTLLQQGLTKRIIEALGLDSKFSTPTDTPADTADLGKNVDGKEASSSINYASVIGMLLYLDHSSPDISFAMHQYAQYIHSPKQSHEDAIKRIGYYLKGTLNKGLILTPSCSLKMDRHLQKNKNYTRHRQLPLSNICTHVTNSHTISHSTFDNIKFVLSYGRAAVAERRQKRRQPPRCGRGHSSSTPALPGGNRRFVAGAATLPLPLCQRRSTIRKYKFNIVKYGMTDSV